MAAAASPSPVTTGSPRTVRPLPLTRGRRAALAIGVPVCLALVGWTGLSVLANFAEGSYLVDYPVPAATRALTMNVTGELTIRPTPAGQASLVGTARYPFVRAALSEHITGRSTTLGYQCAIPVGDCGLTATVAVPATVTALTAHSGSGNATVTGTTGPVTLSTGSGDLSVSNVLGPLALNTDSGNIGVSAIKSPTVSTSSGNGDIRASGVTSATMNANTDSGSITGSGITASAFTASSGNGDITITFTGTPPRDVRVNTNSGNVTLILPPGNTKYHVTAHTDSGAVNDSLPQGESATNEITATSGSGTIILEQQ